MLFLEQYQPQKMSLLVKTVVNTGGRYSCGCFCQTNNFTQYGWVDMLLKHIVISIPVTVQGT